MSVSDRALPSCATNPSGDKKVLDIVLKANRNRQAPECMATGSLGVRLGCQEPKTLVRMKLVSQYLNKIHLLNMNAEERERKRFFSFFNLSHTF